LFPLYRLVLADTWVRWLALPFCGVMTAVAATGVHAFGFDDVAKRAAALAASAYKRPPSTLPKELQALTYDQFRDIRYRPEQSLWRSARLPFEIQFFHKGLYYDQPVRINEVTAEGVREIRFDPAQFDYGKNALDPKRMHGGGFAGFRVHYGLNTPKYKDEVLVFLGASYFRALGKGQRYGLSARALAVDTGLISGEEFPRFVEFWIERPDPNAKELRIFALLDSPRVTGAYRMLLKPGADTAVEVRARLYLREHVAKLGLAPLTSMYFFGEMQRPAYDDYRPEVHDTDGLSVQTGTGEWIWRPLTNPKRLLVTSFGVTNPQGFGLQQRDRRFSSYEDLEARYELRPSAWIEPKGKWGAGRIELVQIPTPDETNDNIVTFFVPDAVPSPQQAYEFEYRLLWQKESETRPPSSWVTQTRRGHGYLRTHDDTMSFVVDFEGPAFKKLAADAKLDAVVTTDGNADIVETNAYRNDVSGGARLVIRLKRQDEKKPVELRAFLRSGTTTLSETWSYIIPPT